MRCYVVLCSVMRCYVVLCSVMWCYVVLCSVMRCYVRTPCFTPAVLYNEEVSSVRYSSESVVWSPVTLTITYPSVDTWQYISVTALQCYSVIVL